MEAYYVNTKGAIIATYNAFNLLRVQIFKTDIGLLKMFNILISFIYMNVFIQGFLLRVIWYGQYFTWSLFAKPYCNWPALQKSKKHALHIGTTLQWFFMVQMKNLSSFDKCYRFTILALNWLLWVKWSFHRTFWFCDLAWCQWIILLWHVQN